MMKDIEKYVLATSESDDAACGVLVDNLFITSGHVVGKNPFRTVINGKVYEFDKKDAILYSWDGNDIVNPNCIDIAVFKVEGETSPITFADTLPHLGDHLRSLSYENLSYEVGIKGDFSYGVPFQTEENKVLHDCDAEVIDYNGKYFVCKTGIRLKRGSSGSPIFCEDKLVGILTGGTELPDACAFLPAKVIIDELNK